MVWGVLYGRERLQCVFVSFAFKGMLAFESFRRYANPVQNICSHSGDEGADAHFIPAVQSGHQKERCSYRNVFFPSPFRIFSSLFLGSAGNSV